MHRLKIFLAFPFNGRAGTQDECGGPLVIIKMLARQYASGREPASGLKDRMSTAVPDGRRRLQFAGISDRKDGLGGKNGERFAFKLKTATIWLQGLQTT
jgi:hypothetical protein